MKNISENTIKLFKSNYKLAISELENKILEKEMELENFLIMIIYLKVKIVIQ